MGLVGFCIAPMMAQISVDYLATSAFARRPALWLTLMSENRSTITYSPSFGYELAGQRINGDAPKLDLSNLRVAGIGGDMVQAGRARHLCKAPGSRRIRPESFFAELWHG